VLFSILNDFIHDISAKNKAKIHTGFRVDTAYLRDEECPGNF